MKFVNRHISNYVALCLQNYLHAALAILPETTHFLYRILPAHICHTPTLAATVGLPGVRVRARQVLAYA